MKKEQLAELINGREYGGEITKEEEATAKATGLIVIFGYSDDNAEFRGAICDEIGCYDGGELYIQRDKVLPNHEDCECQFCGYELAKKNAVKIQAIWGGDEYSWEFRAVGIPAAGFDIMEEASKFCRGIVIDRNDICAF